jgi:hypothetical protein
MGLDIPPPCDFMVKYDPPAFPSTGWSMASCVRISHTLPGEPRMALVEYTVKANRKMMMRMTRALM